jgi:hypothetical protein
MPIYMKDGEIHVSGFAKCSEGVEDEAGDGTGTVLALHEAKRRFRHAPGQDRLSPDGESD